MVPKDPLMQAIGGVLVIGYHAPFRIGSYAAVMVNLPRQPFDGLNERIARGATYVEATYVAFPTIECG